MLWYEYGMFGYIFGTAVMADAKSFIQLEMSRVTPRRAIG